MNLEDDIDDYGPEDLQELYVLTHKDTGSTDTLRLFTLEGVYFCNSELEMMGSPWRWVKSSHV